MQDVRPLLYVEDDNIEIMEWIQGQLKDTERRLAEGRAVLIYLQNQLVHVACDDPGAAIGAQVALPFLQVGCVCFDEQCCGRPISALASKFGVLDGLVRFPLYPGLKCVAELLRRRPQRSEAL